eukprot:1146171-Pelagomonas_calceolata.AAC.3
MLSQLQVRLAGMAHSASSTVHAHLLSLYHHEAALHLLCLFIWLPLPAMLPLVHLNIVAHCRGRGCVVMLARIPSERSSHLSSHPICLVTGSMQSIMAIHSVCDVCRFAAPSDTSLLHTYPAAAQPAPPAVFIQEQPSRPITAGALCHR